MPFEWKNDVSIDDPRANEETLKLILQEAKDRLQGTVAAHDVLITKANVLLGFVVTISMAFVAYCLKDGLPDTLPMMFITLYLVSAALAGWLCVSALQSIKIDVNGYSPDCVFTTEHIGKNDKEVLYFLVHEYGGKILDNIEKLSKPYRQIRLATRIFIGSIVIALCTAFLLVIPTAMQCVK